MTLAWHAESFKGGDGGRSEYTDIHTHTHTATTHTLTHIHKHTHTPYTHTSRKGRGGCLVPPNSSAFLLAHRAGKAAVLVA